MQEHQEEKRTTDKSTTIGETASSLFITPKKHVTSSLVKQGVDDEDGSGSSIGKRLDRKYLTQDDMDRYMSKISAPPPPPQAPLASPPLILPTVPSPEEVSQLLQASNDLVLLCNNISSSALDLARSIRLPESVKEPVKVPEVPEVPETPETPFSPSVQAFILRFEHMDELIGDYTLMNQLCTFNKIKKLMQTYHNEELTLEDVNRMLKVSSLHFSTESLPTNSKEKDLILIHKRIPDTPLPKTKSKLHRSSIFKDLLIKTLVDCCGGEDTENDRFLETLDVEAIPLGEGDIEIAQGSLGGTGLTGGSLDHSKKKKLINDMKQFLRTDDKDKDDYSNSTNNETSKNKNKEATGTAGGLNITTTSDAADIKLFKTMCTVINMHYGEKKVKLMFIERVIDRLERMNSAPRLSRDELYTCITRIVHTMPAKYALVSHPDGCMLKLL